MHSLYLRDKMKLFSDCSGSCDQCYTYYSGGCLAGHGDDLFMPIPNGVDIEKLKKDKAIKDAKRSAELKILIPKMIGAIKQLGKSAGRFQQELLIKHLKK